MTPIHSEHELTYLNETLSQIPGRHACLVLDSKFVKRNTAKPPRQYLDLRVVNVDAVVPVRETYESDGTDRNLRGFTREVGSKPHLYAMRVVCYPSCILMGRYRMVP